MKIRSGSGIARSVALIFVIIAAVPGCASHRVQRPVTPMRADPVDRDIPGQEMAAEILLTSDAASLRQKWYLFRAEQALDAQCMQRLGFRYLVTHIRCASHAVWSHRPLVG